MTATEWLFRQLWEEPKDKFTWYAILDKAMQMEKEQIINAHGIKMKGVNDHKCVNGEQYYNETFKSE
jgi:hypothetical protein